MVIKFASYRLSTQMKFAVAPYIRHAINGKEFEVIAQVQKSNENKHGLE